MEHPKLVIFSNGDCTAVLLDGVLLGSGVERFELSAEYGKVTLNVMGIDVSHVEMDKNPDVTKFLNCTKE